MKNCPNCGKRLYRQAPENAEYGTAVVDGRHYPEECPECGHPL
jgi:rRNA maturation protein Nop10